MSGDWIWDPVCYSWIFINARRVGYGGRGGDLEHGVRVVLSLLVPFRVKQGAEKDAAALRSPKGLPPCPGHVWGRAGSVL